MAIDGKKESMDVIIMDNIGISGLTAIIEAAPLLSMNVSFKPPTTKSNLFITIGSGYQAV